MTLAVGLDVCILEMIWKWMCGWYQCFMARSQSGWELVTLQLENPRELKSVKVWIKWIYLLYYNIALFKCFTWTSFKEFRIQSRFYKVYTNLVWRKTVSLEEFKAFVWFCHDIQNPVLECLETLFWDSGLIDMNDNRGW